MSFHIRHVTTDEEVVAMLLVKDHEGLGYNPLYVGPGAFKFMLANGIISTGTADSACSSLRIFNYGKMAMDEVGYEVTADGKIRDPKGRIHDPEVILSNSKRKAKSGYEVDSLADGWRELIYRLADEMGIDRPDG